ncbi:ATP-dependent helicase HrpB [Granulicella tundricola]|uniref:ATP-dependent helicase HrpB n=1 Tax=Granulicella tundricola (strain ATCC BAA-1859 / DSM 23138 / MP5ACTX9) TaxID=1198114 RepID=E8X5A4_GRATM|nr:ATP-dependent helicase HrpB [Granulicella tundricola]ADW68368.1 ATP-dependent helicase HrpB [Granulicella tundricola MP5ACTX9]
MTQKAAVPFALPIDEILPAILSSLARTPNLVIEAAPGAGKTTRVPPALLGLVQGEILVLEPRRIAARLAARRVAAELGEEVGGTVGYQVRFEEVSGPRTRLRFVTEGILTRRLIGDPTLKGVDAVVLDEFHERHLDGDLALALLKRLQVSRPELRIVVMSATLEAAAVSEYLGGCPMLRSEGRLFELAVRHMPYSPLTLAAQVRHGVELLTKDESSGHILVFLPGAAEIRKAMRECETVARKAGMIVLQLHGDLTPAEQDRVVSPSAERKLILATNVAESSVTIDGVSAVIDSGLARVASYSPWTGLPTLAVSRVSKASARQRAGRAGRTGPGRVLRLYSEEDYRQRADHDAPEIVRSDLAQLCLALRVMGLAGFDEIDWLDAPPPPAVERAEKLLDGLGAVGAMAEKMSRYPLPPRLARLVVESQARGVGAQGCLAAAMLSSGERSPQHDLLTALEAEHDGRTLQLQKQLGRIAHAKEGRDDDDALLLSVLSGHPDRVARLRAGSQVLLSSGGSAELDGEPPPYEFMVALEVEDRTEKPLPLIRMTARIEPEWLIDLFPERMREVSSLSWHRTAERVEAVETLLYEELIVQESRDSMPAPEAAAALLAEKMLEVGVTRFVEEAALADLNARIEVAGITPPDLSAVLNDLCFGKRSFAELKNSSADLLAMLEQAAGQSKLREAAPTSVKLPSGRQTKVHYETGKPPWIASRLQDFFGMTETPRIGPGRTPVVVHLLAPNHRAVQTTTDLEGFWTRLYPQVRRELMRRYPRHAWPERPE